MSAAALSSLGSANTGAVGSLLVTWACNATASSVPMYCRAGRPFFVEPALHVMKGLSASKNIRPRVRLCSSLDRNPVVMAVSYNIARSAPVIPCRSGPPAVAGFNHAHSSGNNIRRSRFRSVLGSGFLTEVNGSRGNLWLCASHLVNPLMAVKFACTVRADFFLAFRASAK
ncbi:MAG: hypothetical protein NTY19_27730 [Planctomycetota bacterium]|nr:hypothetical protein [Planctomycetota bacterium]